MIIHAFRFSKFHFAQQVSRRSLPKSRSSTRTPRSSARTTSAMPMSMRDSTPRREAASPIQIQKSWSHSIPSLASLPERSSLIVKGSSSPRSTSRNCSWSSASTIAKRKARLKTWLIGYLWSLSTILSTTAACHMSGSSSASMRTGTLTPFLAKAYAKMRTAPASGSLSSSSIGMKKERSTQVSGT